LTPLIRWFFDNSMDFASNTESPCHNLACPCTAPARFSILR
jgi:hypothetical protein